MLFIYAVLLALFIGAAPALLLNYYKSYLQINWKEFSICGILVVLVALLTTVVWGPDVARAQAVAGYKEFWNGSIVAAKVEETTCTRDGSCVHTYRCDPYIVMVTKYRTVSDGVDSEGRPKTKTESYQEPETRYHSCPEATFEYTYWLEDNLGRGRGDLTIADHIFAAQPQEWRAGHGLSNVPRGVPDRWLQSKQRLDAGDPEPVTKINEYDNYILASSDSLLKRYSADIEAYKAQALLPEHTQNLKGKTLHDHDMQARKMSFVDTGVADQEKWQAALMQFNAALGTQLQGDMHVVVVPASQVDNPDAYINALMAYWQGPDFGKWGLAKNGIALVLGIDDSRQTVVWARAKTGMPVGNGEMLSALQFELGNTPFDPDAIFGHPLGQPYVNEAGKTKVKYVGQDSGLVGRIIFVDFPFARACMDCKDKEDSGTGYTYLESTIPVPFAAKVWMMVIVGFISGLLWALFAWYPLFEPITPLRRTRDGAYISIKNSKPTYRTPNPRSKYF